MRRLVPAALLLLAVAPVSAAARAHVISAYAYYKATPNDRAQLGWTFVYFRTDRPLRTNSARFPTATSNLGYIQRVSPEFNCYVTFTYVDRRFHRVGRPGTRLRVSLGRRGSLYDRTLRVQPYRPGYDRGGLLGCTQDPKANYVIFQTEPDPEVTPPRIFFAADASPYLDELRWIGWGTRRAVARGVYANDCSNCSPEFRRRTTVVYDGRAWCEAFGAWVYSGRTTVFDSPTEPRRVTLGANTAPC